MEPQNLDDRPEPMISERAVPAIVLIAVGAIFFLNNLQIVALQDVLRFWPGILIALGIVLVVDSTEPRTKAVGGILAGVGGLLLARNLGYIVLYWRDMWPLILIGLGVLMLIDRTCLHIGETGAGWQGRMFSRMGRNYQRMAGFSTGGWQRGMFRGMGAMPKESTVFGSVNRNYAGQEFAGGRYETVFGGIEIDLRGSHMVGDEARMKVDAVMGGVEIKVPDTWLAIVKGSAFMGAVVNHSKAPDPVLVPNPKRLIVKAAAVFGGVEIKN
jgi:hypothetical protein